MKCLSCNESVTWHRPIIYLGYNRAVHLDEWVGFIKHADLIKRELLMEKKKLVIGEDN